MCDSDNHHGLIVDTGFSRRSAMQTIASAIAVAGCPTTALAATRRIIERNVRVPTGDGLADGALFHPAGRGAWPAVLMWPDILGLRPVFRAMGHRLAAEGYAVLIPNPFYRSRKAPIVTGPFDFGDKAAMAKLMTLKDTLTDERVNRDAAAFIAFLDQQKAVNRHKSAAVQGYCFGGPLAFRTAAARPDRIRAVATFHGGGLVTKDADSPHLVIAQTKAQYLVDIARNDDAAQPDAKTILKAAFAAAGRPASVEVFPANHGWCVPGAPAYDAASAERAWAQLLRLYRSALA